MDRDEKLESLPKGYIVCKNINGKNYYYLQWREGDSKKSKYIPFDEVEETKRKIELRKTIEKSAKQKLSSSFDKDIYVLMHKRIPVLEFKINKKIGWITEIVSIINSKHIPIGVSYKKGVVDRRALNEWIVDRAIPETREELDSFKNANGIESIAALLFKNNGASLSDHYWFKKKCDDLEWEKINYFTNSFSSYVGESLLGIKTKVKDFHSPDITTDGNLKKRWKILNGVRLLYKGGSSPYRQQPFGEVIASYLCDFLDVDYIPYYLSWEDSMPYSVCPDFLNVDTELIPAWRILNTRPRNSSESLYQHFITCAEGLGLRDVRESLERMMVVDYLLANEDRHFNNFGAIRDANTLEMISMAPIYDSGSCLGYNKREGDIKNNVGVECKPFKKTHVEQLRLVKDFSWIDFDELFFFGDTIRRVLHNPWHEDYYEEERIEAIVASFEERVRELHRISMNNIYKDEISEDKEENIAQTYGK